MPFFQRLAALAGQPVDAASLNLFRCLFGLLVFVEAIRFLLHGWVDTYFLSSSILFKYPGFDWVSVWPGNGLYWHFGLLALLALMVALGFFYRLAIVGLTLCFGYVFLLDQGLYLNQYYLMLTLAFLLCFMPAERGFSLDALRRRESLASSVPRWNIAALRFQFEVMLIYAGLVKLNPDWLRGEPLSIWLSQRADIPLAGPWLSTPGLGEAASLGVIALHLIGAPLLLLRETRLAVFLIYVPFHLANSMLFHIGLFPWITLSGTLLFFDPDWPRDILRRLQGDTRRQYKAAAAPPSTHQVSPVVLIVIIAFLALQILIPMRGMFYPGRASWTGEGDWFAWRMKLDDRICTSSFTITNRETGYEKKIDPEDHLNARQAQLMVSNPDMLLQFARYLERLEFEHADLDQIEVRAAITCALNGRPDQPFIDENLDLTDVTRSWRHYDWIQPLAVTLQNANNALP